MANNVLWIVFCLSILLFIIAFASTKKLHVFAIIKSYCSIYLGGYDIKKKRRRFAFSSILCVGILPYVIGVTGTLLFEAELANLDFSFLVSFDGILISILSVFFGLGIFVGKDDVKKETSSVLFVSIIMLLLDALVLWITLIMHKEKLETTIPWCIYYGIKVKVLVLFIVSFHNVYYLSDKNMTNE